MTKAAYYKFDLVLESALSIGAADSSETDNDVVRDSRGLPMIPGTSIAGVLRSYFSLDEADKLFGKRLRFENDDASKTDKGNELTEGCIKIFDATWVDGNKSVSVRDNVSLENKVAKKGLKFDRQIVERGARFHTHIEIPETDKFSTKKLEDVLAALNAGELRFGAKTTRGLGRVKVENCSCRLFDFDNQSETLFDLNNNASWFNFDPFAREWTGDIPVAFAGHTVADSVVITLSLKQRGALSIREYSTDPGRPDFSQMHVRDSRITTATGDDDVPIVPGTSWAGAFSDCYERNSSSQATEQLFGYVKKVEETDSTGKKVWVTKTRRSRITFSETELADGSWKEVTRNSIDRFTGGTKDGALFTMRTYYNGSSKDDDLRTKLEIRVLCKDEHWDADTFAPLIVAIADLHNGFMPVGGLTGIGHGMFEVTSATCKVYGTKVANFEEGLLKEVSGLPSFIAPDVETVAASIAQVLEHKLSNNTGETEGEGTDE